MVDVYEAEIRRLRNEKEVLVIQLKDALAQLQTLKEEQIPFSTSQKGLSSICNNFY